MEDSELLESVRELVSIADAGIADAVSTLATDSDPADTQAILDACLSNVEIIATAVEMAQLEDLQAVCAALDAHLRSLNGDAERYLREYGPRLANWGGAVLMYLHQPDALEFVENLLGPLPDSLRAGLLIGSRLTTATTTEPVEMKVDDGTAIIREAETKMPPEPHWPEPEISLSVAVETAPVDRFVDPDTVPVADEITKEIPLDFVAMVQADDPVPEWAMESARIDAGSALEMQISEEPNNPLFGEISPPTNEDHWDEERTQPLPLDAAVESDMEPAPQVLEAETDTVDLVSSISENGTETLDITPDAPVYGDKADASIAELLEQLAEPRAELKSWLEILTAPTENPIERAGAAAGYIGAIERVRAASETANLPGLVALCMQITRNVETLAKLDARARSATRAVMEEWPAVVLAYLNDPADEDLCLAVITHLSRPVWPYPLTEEQAAELVALLAPDDDDSLTKVEARPALVQPEDVALVLGDDLNPRLMTVFLQEAPANAARFTECVGHISRGEEVSQNLGVAQRLAHNLKGSANMIGVKGVANLTHHLEDILEYLSEQQLAPPPPLANTLQEGADCIEAMLEALQGLTAPPPDALRILQDIYDWANRVDTGQLEAMPVVSKDVPIPEVVPAVANTESGSVTVAIDTESGSLGSVAIDTESGSDTIAAVSPVAGAEREETVAPPSTTPATQVGAAEAMLRVPAATFDALFRLVGEFSISIDQLQERFRAVQRQSNELRNQDLLIQQRRFELESFVDVRHVAAVQQRFHRNGGHEQFDPLELDEYDELYGATRGFVETVTDSRKMLLQLRGELASVEHLFVQVQRMKRELQQTVIRTRMEPVSILGARLARSVRQACRATGKQAELLLEGADVLLDSEVLNKLVDPLMHMLRNAVDHGIERSEQRVATGKPVTGIVRLRFFQEGHHVVIDCTDDGGGLNYAHIRETAARKGLAHIDTTDHQALARLVLTPGFTTRTSATQLSGRGVGLDVVHSAIKELKGVMEIGDNQPSGCRIRLRVPLSLMTHYCLVVEVAGRQYAIPTSAVDRALSPKIGQFSQVGSEIAYDLDRHIYPARSLQACLQDTSGGDFDAQKAVLLAYSDMGLIALAIDRVIDSYHLVVRGLGRYVKTARGVAGVSSLPDGRLIPVLDLAELLRVPTRETASVAQSRLAAPNLATLAAPRVLIVDDSLSVRQSLAELMTESGYQPLLARDGVEAMEMLRKQSPDIVLTDIEMPRMNGLELASYIRATHGTTLPIVTITSRTMQKHRQLAQQVGVDLYLTKPFAEDQLLSGIRSLLH